MTTRLSSVILMGSLLAGMGTGCHQDADSSRAPDSTGVAAGREAAPQPAAQSSSGTPSANDPSSHQEPASTAGTNAASEPAVDLGLLTRAVRRYSAERRRVPANLNEVIATGYLPNVPPAPVGKKYGIEPKRLEVVLVNQ